MKVAFRIAYDGTSFSGLARQKGAVRTVQGDVEAALATVLGSPIETVCAGRTDAGVHSSAQVLSFDVPDGTDPQVLGRRVSSMVGPDVVVRDATAVPDDFSARFSARRRAYEYRCYRSDVVDPFRERFWVRIDPSVRVPPMRDGAKALVGEHDFTSFCRKGSTHLVRRIRRIAITARADEVVFKIEGDAFCHQMVRSVVGLLLDVGRGKRAPADVGRALRARDRAAAGPVAPAKGLHLVRVDYRPDPFGG